MFVRSTELRTDPEAVEAGIAYFKNTVAPKLGAMPGNLGVSLIVNRETGEAVGSTFWESLEAMNAAEEAGQQSRQGSAQETSGRVVDVDRYEIVLLDRKGEAGGRRFARANTLYAATGKQDASVAFMTDTVVARLREMDGYLGATAGINRFTGRAFFVSAWASPEARAASAEAVAALREQAREVAGAGGVRVVEGETVILQMKQPATA